MTKPQTSLALARKTGHTPNRPKKNTKAPTTSAKKHREDGEPALVPLADIKFDNAYQRLLIPAHVKKIEASFDPMMVGAVHLSARGNTLFAVDGQHRIVVLRNLGKTHVAAIVHRGLNQVEEADLFIRLNRVRASLGSWDWYNAEITARLKTALEIQDIISKSRFTMEREGDPKFNIEAVAAVRTVHGWGVLKKTLRITGEYWYGSNGATKREPLKALALFLRTQSDETVFDETRLAKVLLDNHPHALMVEGKSWVAEEFHTKADTSFLAEYIRYLYNKRLSQSKKLTKIIRREKRKA